MRSSGRPAATIVKARPARETLGLHGCTSQPTGLVDFLFHSQMLSCGYSGLVRIFNFVVAVVLVFLFLFLVLVFFFAMLSPAMPTKLQDVCLFIYRIPRVPRRIRPIAPVCLRCPYPTVILSGNHSLLPSIPGVPVATRADTSAGLR